LLDGKLYSVDLVREQAHRENSGRYQSREFVVVCGEENLEVAPADFDQVSESILSALKAARRRLAEITSAE
jgi:hypothetical protein